MQSRTSHTILTEKVIVYIVPDEYLMARMDVHLIVQVIVNLIDIKQKRRIRIIA